MDTAPNRDGQGRFAAGNPGGPGRPRTRGDTLRRAAEDAVSPEHVAAIIRRATRMALEGNLAAMRLVLERTCGRVAEAPAEASPLGVDLPRMRTAADCMVAIERIGDAVTKGECELNAAKVLVDVTLARLKAIEVNEHEARLVELEKAASTVDLPGSRRRS